MAGAASPVKLSPDQIDYVAFQLLKRLQDERVLELEAFEPVERRLVQVISDDLMVEDKLNAEVREVLAQHEASMRQQGVQYHEMFKAVKAKLVRERKLIL